MPEIRLRFKGYQFLTILIGILVISLFADESNQPNTGTPRKREPLSIQPNHAFELSKTMDISSGSLLHPPEKLKASCEGAAVRLNWQLSNLDFDIKNYGVFRSQQKNFAPTAGNFLGYTLTATYLDDSPMLNKMNHYRIIAYDQYGNASLPSAIATVMSYNFPQPGWFMVSLPLTPASNLVADLFPQAVGGCAYLWNGVGYSTTTTMSYDRGYWLAFENANASNISGEPIYTLTKNFPVAGWYMIGPMAEDMGFADPQDVPDGSVLSPAFTFNRITHSYQTTITLAAGHGYWVAVLQACDLIITGGSGCTARKENATHSSPIDFFNRFGKTPPLPPGETPNSEVPEYYILRQNYPNPFNGITFIQFGLQEISNVKIIIYDLKGEFIKMLVNREMDAGYYEVPWDGRDEIGKSVATGVYFYRFNTIAGVQTRKMLMLR